MGAVCSFPENPLHVALGMEQGDRVDPELYQLELLGATILSGDGDERVRTFHQLRPNLRISDADVPHEVVELVVAVAAGLEFDICAVEQVLRDLGLALEELQPCEETLVDCSPVRELVLLERAGCLVDEVLGMGEEALGHWSVLDGVGVLHVVQRVIVLDKRGEQGVVDTVPQRDTEVVSRFIVVAADATDDSQVLGSDGDLVFFDALFECFVIRVVSAVKVSLAQAEVAVLHVVDERIILSCHWFHLQVNRVRIELGKNFIYYINF